MDEQIMLNWVEELLQWYIASAPADIIPIIFCDMYHFNMMGFIVNAIKNFFVGS